MSKYIPTTDEVENRYVQSRIYLVDFPEKKARKEFKRWMEWLWTDGFQGFREWLAVHDQNTAQKMMKSITSVHSHDISLCKDIAEYNNGILSEECLLFQRILDKINKEYLGEIK